MMTQKLKKRQACISGSSLKKRVLVVEIMQEQLYDTHLSKKSAFKGAKIM